MTCRYCEKPASLRKRAAYRAWMFVVGRADFGAPASRIELALHDYSADVCSVCLGRNR